MFKDKSFLGHLGNLSSNLNSHHLRSKSQSSRALSQKPVLYSPEKNYIRPSYESPQSINYLYRSNLANYPRQRPGSFVYDYHIYKRQPYQNMASLKMFSPLDSINFYKYKNDLNRSHSLNQMHQHQRIQMLNKMNSVLDNHIDKKRKQLKFNETQHKTRFQNHIITKIDRLESYLYKIKRQRQKEEVPKNKIKSENLVNQFKVEKSNTQQTNQSNYKKFQSVFEQLDKIKSQLIKVRNAALQVKKRNSLSKDKKPHLSQIDKNIIKKEFVLQHQIKYQPTNSTQSTIHAMSSFPKFQQIRNNNFPTPKFNMPFKDRRENNHINQVKNNKHLSYAGNNQYIQTKIIDQGHSISKPTVTFSFKNNG